MSVKNHQTLPTIRPDNDLVDNQHITSKTQTHYITRQDAFLSLINPGKIDILQKTGIFIDLSLLRPGLSQSGIAKIVLVRMAPEDIDPQQKAIGVLKHAICYTGVNRKYDNNKMKYLNRLIEKVFEIHCLQKTYLTTSLSTVKQEAHRHRKHKLNV